MKKRLLIIGGHLTPALAVTEEVRRSTDWEIIWVGRKFAMEGKAIPSLEYEVIPKLGIPFYELATGRLQRKWTVWTLPSFFRIPFGFFKAFWLLLKLRPDVILSFGGYLSLPIVVAGWVLQIPVILHEQTTTSGLANRAGSWFAKAIAISFQSSLTEFPYQKVVLTGNPVRKSILTLQKKGARPPIIFITGGSQGSHIINQAVERIVPALVKSFQVFHQTGFIDYEHFTAWRKKLPRVLRNRYQVFSVVFPDKVAQILGRSCLVVGRAGANTITELAAAGVPAILIPLPWSERGEQEKNARVLARAGMAKVIVQEQLTPELLLSTIEELYINLPPPSARRLARKLVRKDASKRLVELIRKYM